MLVEWEYALIKAKLDIYTWFVYQNVDNRKELLNDTRKYEIQHYERKFVSDLRQVGGFGRLLWNIVESGVKHHKPNQASLVYIHVRSHLYLCFQSGSNIYIIFIWGIKWNKTWMICSIKPCNITSRSLIIAPL